MAEELTTGEPVVRGLIQRGELPAIQVGGRGQWRIEHVKLEEYITAAYARAAANIRRGDITENDQPTVGDEGEDRA